MGCNLVRAKPNPQPACRANGGGSAGRGQRRRRQRPRAATGFSHSIGRQRCNRLLLPCSSSDAIFRAVRHTVWPCQWYRAHTAGRAAQRLDRTPFATENRCGDQKAWSARAEFPSPPRAPDKVALGHRMDMRVCAANSAAGLEATPAEELVQAGKRAARCSCCRCLRSDPPQSGAQPGTRPLQQHPPEGGQRVWQGAKFEEHALSNSTRRW